MFVAIQFHSHSPWLVSLPSSPTFPFITISPHHHHHPSPPLSSFFVGDFVVSWFTPLHHFDPYPPLSQVPHFTFSCSWRFDSHPFVTLTLVHPYPRFCSLLSAVRGSAVITQRFVFPPLLRVLRRPGEEGPGNGRKYQNTNLKFKTLCFSPFDFSLVFFLSPIFRRSNFSLQYI